MYKTGSGDLVCVIDAHVHLWNAAPSNQRNRYGAGFIDSFYDSHVALTPPALRWPKSKFLKYDAQQAFDDIFVNGYCDAAVMLPVDLKEFFIEGFNTVDQCSALKRIAPDRVVLNARLDPRDGEAGLDEFEAGHQRRRFKGAKFYTAEWSHGTRGYSLRDEASYRYLQKCVDLDVKNIHVHKGPSSYPLSIDAFDVRDVDHAATDFPQLNFIVDHCGIPRIDDFCWIAAQERNVYGGLAAIINFVWRRPTYFASLLADLLFFCGPDRLLFGSDYAITEPSWIVEQFMEFQLSDQLMRDCGHELTLDVKRKIMGLNAAKLYDLDADALVNRPVDDVRPVALAQ